MAKEHTVKPTLDDSNISELKKAIHSGVRQIEALKADRADVNAKIGEVRASLAAQGIPKKALDMAMAYIAMDADKREGFDVAYSIVREAMGMPMHVDDLFTAADKRNAEGGGDGE